MPKLNSYLVESALILKNLMVPWPSDFLCVTEPFNAHCNELPVVVLVAGYVEPASAMLGLQNFLASLGLRPFIHRSRVHFGKIESMSNELSHFTDWLIQKYELTKISFVAHSMGGLIVRDLLASKSLGAKTDFLMTLGTPHKGTPYAHLGVGTCAKQMRPGSDFIKKINQTAALKTLPSCFINVIATEDTLVPSSCALHSSSTKTVVLKGLTHMQLLEPCCYPRLAKALRSEGLVK